MDKAMEGGCLCGAVRYSSEAEALFSAHCYCVDCRKASGTSHGTHVAIGEDSLRLDGDLTFYDRAADSGNVVSRGFCPHCGSAILSRNSAMPGLAFIRASSLDDLEAVEPQMSVYASRAPSWAMIDEGKPVFETIPEGGAQAILQDG